MKRDTTIEEKPLKFHNFIRFVALPLLIIFGLINLALGVAGKPLIMDVMPLSLVYYSVMIVVDAIMFMGFIKWKAYAWYLIIIQIVLTVALCLFLTIAYASCGDLVYMFFYMIALIISIVVAYPMVIYYVKRKSLFFTDADNHTEMTQGPG